MAEMSELKVIDLGNIRESIENNESVYYEYYAKSEADKVMADLEESHKMEVEQLLILRTRKIQVFKNNKKYFHTERGMGMKLAFTIHWYGGCSADVPTTHETYIAEIQDDILPAEVRGKLAGNNHDTEMSISIVKEGHK